MTQKTYTIDEIVDCFDRAEELQEMPLSELCQEAGITHTIKCKVMINNIISDVLIKEYGHQILPFYLNACDKLEQLQISIPDYSQSLVDVLLYECGPIINQLDSKLNKLNGLT